MKNERKNPMVRIATLDIENMALLGWAWGTYEQNILHIEHPQHLLCVSWKWLGEPVQTVSIWDSPNYKKDTHSDRYIAEAIWMVLDEADIIIGHNVDRFDIRMMNAMFMRFGMTPPSPYKTIDTLKVAKRNGRFMSNRLNDLGEEFGIGKKLKHQGFPFWLAVDKGDQRAQRKMVRYCEQDVKLTERLYKHLLPWIPNHPALNVLADRPNACPNCLGEHIQARGLTPPTKVGRWRRYVCTDCGKWLRGRATIKSEVRYVN